MTLPDSRQTRSRPIPAGAATSRPVTWLGALLLGAGGVPAVAAPPPPTPPAPPPPVAPDECTVTPGTLSQAGAGAPIVYINAQNWCLHIDAGVITLRPPRQRDITADPLLRYEARNMRDYLGVHEVNAWSDERRTLLLSNPVAGGAGRITMQGQDGQIRSVSVYDGARSFQIDLLTQTVTWSHNDLAQAQAIEAAEADGETANLMPMWTSGSRYEISEVHLTSLYVEPADAHGVPLQREAAVRWLGRLSRGNLRVAHRPPPTDAGAAQACAPTTEPQGNLARLPDGPLRYTSRSGVWVVDIDKSTITVHGFTNFKYEIWGNLHENLNGKHIKDFEQTRRTLVTDDGMKITLRGDGAENVVHTVSIHDGEQTHEVDNLNGVVRYSCVNAQVAAAREAAEADGETAYLQHLRGPRQLIGSVYVENVYYEEEGVDGAPGAKEFAPQALGESADMEWDPHDVIDYYDDPRLGHT